ncbi:hypothetical protein H263_11924 [Brachyspira hampsonii 30599]|nr:hypothetical protein H263_11924 [Brachyspira hampsonii 30599]
MDNQITQIRIGFSNIVIFRNIIKTKVNKKIIKIFGSL